VLCVSGTLANGASTEELSILTFFPESRSIGVYRELLGKRGQYAQSLSISRVCHHERSRVISFCLPPQTVVNIKLTKRYFSADAVTPRREKHGA